jgi:hypothetical protein
MPLGFGYNERRYNNLAPSRHEKPIEFPERRAFTSAHRSTPNAIALFDMTQAAKEDILHFRHLYLQKALHWWSTTKKNINAGKAPTEEDHLLNDIVLDENHLLPKGVRGARLGVDLDKLHLDDIKPLLKSYEAYNVFRENKQRHNLKGVGGVVSRYGGARGTRKRSSSKRKQTKRR